MRRFVLCAALVFFMLTLAFSSPPTTNTARAIQSPDPCVRCQGRCQKRYDRCLAQTPMEEQQQCHDGFNSCIVDCYATVCEQ